MDLSTTSTSASAICHQCFTISFLRDVMVNLKVSSQSSTKRSLNVSMMASSLSLYDWASTGFCGPESGKLSSSGTLMISGCFDAMSVFGNPAWGRSHTRVATSKTRQIMVFLAQNTSLYRVHDFDPLTDPWSVFYTNQSPSSIHCLWSISGYGGQSQHCWSKEIHCRHQLLVLCTCRLQGKHSWISYNNIRTHSQSYIKMYN